MHNTHFYLHNLTDSIGGAMYNRQAENSKFIRATILRHFRPVVEAGEVCV